MVVFMYPEDVPDIILRHTAVELLVALSRRPTAAS